MDTERKEASVDERRFDRLSRRLASSGSRRQALRAIGGAAVATVIASRTRTGAQSCTPHHQSCQSDEQCCPGAVCQWGICAPGCRIEGEFVNSGGVEPGNTCASCNPAVSTIAWSPANEGMACWSGDLCAGPSTCQGGTCRGSSPVVCQALTACHVVGECDPATGLCTNPPADVGTPCGAPDICHGGFFSPGLKCDGNGFCVGGQAVDCAPYGCGSEQCRTTCDHDDQCAPGAVCGGQTCAHPAPDGSPCDHDRHCVSNRCVGGICGAPGCTTSADCAGGAACVAGACRQSIAGEISDSTVGTRMCNFIGGIVSPYPNDLYVFEHGGGPVQIGVRRVAAPGSDFDPALAVYQGVIDYEAPCDNRIATAHAGGCVSGGFSDVYLTLDLAAGTYSAVVLGEFSDQRGPYTLTFGLGAGC